jgi:hypothetical protein
MSEVTIDFIVKDPWRMVLVEEGPWEDVSANLRRVQSRLYGCIDAAIDGYLAQQFPESNGAHVTVQLDCYSVPQDEVSTFFKAFSSSVLHLPSYKDALHSSSFVAGFDFQINFA